MENIAYRVRSEATLYSPVTDDEVNGRIIDTRNADGVIPQNSILFFSQPVHNQNVIVNITGPAGLYVALPPGAEEGTHVIWSQKPFLWEVIPTIEGGQITYHMDVLIIGRRFVPANGGNLYIFDEFGIGAVLVVKPGDKIVAPESYFTITPA
ncbi:hypothetical protein BJ165DRAFT_1405024 [Panaeolus papilionaceus]|nr:hypothetical protein BJ165DRAFT_1405024 [Panaeolus papilionaceus]